jgi:hypothetical protein
MDFQSMRGRLDNENADLIRQTEDADGQLQQLQRVRSAMVSQLDEVTRGGEEESRVCRR